MKLHVDLKENGYDILVEHGILAHIQEVVDLKRKDMIITDENVPKAYTDTIAKQCKEAYIEVLPAGEASKQLSTFQALCEKLLNNHFSRKDCVLALGGGVIGDVSGFVASAYMRGIDFIQVPTTTLSQIDSSIGGKVAVNLNEVKNIIGAFYQPCKVIIDPDTLQSLPKRHYINGLIEALKAGLIYDASLFELFESEDIQAVYDTILYKALCVKKAVVEKDEKEQNLRKILNFGHTIGHAIESYYHLEEYLHGECVAMGMLYFIDDPSLKQRVLRVYERLGIQKETSFDPTSIYHLLCNDKKASGNSVTCVHVKELGKAELIETPLELLKTKLGG